jgi:hypothetical protein
VKPPDAEKLQVQIHGEYQLRYNHLSDLALTPTTTAVNATPGITSQPLGQNDWMNHWLRLTPRLQIRDNIEVVGQLDVLSGVILGDLAKDTRADQTPRDEHDGFKNVQPRWLYGQVVTKIGLFRLGQMGNHWGMGLLANDGDRPPLFGDYRYGSIVEQIAFATRPGGKDHPVVVALAGNLVFKDANARIERGDRAFSGILAAYWEKGPNRAGLWGVYRSQRRDRDAIVGLSPFTESIDVGVIDIAGNFAAPIETPGPPSYVFGTAEGAMIFGSTNALRTQDQALSGDKTTVRSYGAAARAGIVIGAYQNAPALTGQAPPIGFGPPRPDLFGRFVAQMEIGYASGDADPYDGVQKRFVFDPNFKVGLLLFDEVLRWQTARSATAATDPLLTNRPAPGSELLPSNGGVFGAQYINPTMIVRPRRWLDLKAGAVIAQTTADMVDPYRLVTQGAYVNYRGGDARRHDLGIELDLGVEARANLDYGLVAQVGAQAGVLFPGGALADAAGDKLKTPWIAVGRAGLLF